MELKERIAKNSFLFEELVKRDFKEKYKRTILGMAWSVLSPLLSLAVMSFVFTRFFGHSIPNYTIYLFCGNLVMSFFRESTRGGMNSLLANSRIITKINIPKHLFLLSKNVSVLINFCINLIVFFFFCIIYHIQFGWHFFMLIYMTICLTVFNVGVGLILSALYVFFRDVTYIYDIFLILLNYMSAIFYSVDSFPSLQKLFLCNPIYVYIKYFRTIVLDGTIPSLAFHLLCAFYALLMLGIGFRVYKKYNHQFLYYL